MQRPTVLPSSKNNVQNSMESTDRYTINTLSPSPIQTNVPHIFRPGMLFNNETFQRIEAATNENRNRNDDDDDDDDDTSTTHMELFDVKTIEKLRDEEIQHLTQLIIKDRPQNDPMANQLFEEIQDILPQETIVSSSYPPINQVGIVSDHDRPFAEYGHLDRQTIAQAYQFNLQLPNTTTAVMRTTDTEMNLEHLRPRYNCKSFAITAWTNVPKETVMDAIKKEFGITKIQYICIGEEISELNHRRHLHIQIILKDKVNKKKYFLNDVTQTHCNYQVTHNDLAWNEYVKKCGNFIEFNTFKSTTIRSKMEWPSTPFVASSASSSSSSPPRSLSSRRTTTTKQLDIQNMATTMTVRAQAEQRRLYEKQIAIQALQLAKINVKEAMDTIQKSFPSKFLTHSSWYLTTFNYIRLRAQQEADRQDIIQKEYIWPHSFPQCTPGLQDAINRWIKHHFSRAKRAKCLILIGPTNTGKTSFALSLPGRVNYFKGRWNLDAWNDYARYSVYDDIPWDQFQNLNYPNKKDLLTQNGKINATDKYRGTKEINVLQPAIVLLNPEDAGSLLQQPTTEEQRNIADYWQKRAFIYRMGPNEYFHKHRPQTRATSTNSSNSSSISPNNERFGDSNEFERMYQQYHEKHSK